MADPTNAIWRHAPDDIRKFLEVNIANRKNE